MTFIRMPAPVHRAAASADTRLAMASIGAYLPREGDAGVLAATDGKMAALVPVAVLQRGDLPPCALLPHAAVKEARITRKNPCPGIGIDGGMARADKADASYPLPEGTFPPVAEVLPSAHRINGCRAVALNPAMLATLAEAIGGAESVVLLIDDDAHKPMTVFSPESDAVGVLMPMSLPGRNGNTCEERMASGLARSRELAITRLNTVSAIVRKAEADSRVDDAAKRFPKGGKA